MNLDDEPGSIRIRTLYFNPYIGLTGERIDVLCRLVPQADNPVFRDQFLKEEFQQAFSALCAE